MMTNAQLATASLDDIVFDGRNQTYGAFVLRQLYQRHVTRALLMALSLLALLVGGQALARLLAGPVAVVRYVPTGPLNPIVPPAPADPVVVPPAPAAARPAAPVARALKLNNFRIVRHDQPADVVPEQQQLATARVAAVASATGAAGAVPEGLAAAGPDAATSATVSDKFYVYVEQMPELPGGGGQAAIVAAIQRATHYPALALANGVEGKVFASFVVNAQGEVTDLKIVRGLGSGLDQETLRAIGTLPRFIPGRQNGRAVSVQYTVPIAYRIGN